MRVYSSFDFCEIGGVVLQEDEIPEGMVYLHPKLVSTHVPKIIGDSVYFLMIWEQKGIVSFQKIRGFAGETVGEALESNSVLAWVRLD